MRLTGASQQMRQRVGDGYGRADSNTTIGLAESGHAYILGNLALNTVVYGVASNRGYMVSSPTTTWTDGTIDTGLADCTVEALYAVLNTTDGNHCGLAFRSTDPRNFFLAILTTAGTASIEGYINGAGVMLASAAFGRGPLTTDVYKVVMSGTSISFYINGTLAVSLTSTARQTATRHGLVFYGAGNDGRMDNLKVYR